MTARRLAQVVTVLAAVWFLATTAGDTNQRSAAVDEPLHLFGGWTCWSLGDYRVHPTNGALTQRWLTLPYFILRPTLPSTESSEFRKPTSFGLPIACQFVYESGNDPDRLLAAARTMNALLGLALAAVTAWASRWVFPKSSGMLAFVLVCLCPNIVGNAALATSDLAAAFGFLLATLTWGRLLERCTPARLLASVFSCGLLAGLKMSAPLIVVVYILTGGLIVVRRRGWRWSTSSTVGIWRSRASRVAALVAILAIQSAGAVAMVWSYYGFRSTAFTTQQAGVDDFEDAWEVVLDDMGVKGSALRFARDHRLLPEAYIYGVAHTLKHAERRAAFLNGRYSETGWWYYFPLVFLMKTPLPTLGLLLLATWAGMRASSRSGDVRLRARRQRMIERATSLVVLVAVYTIAACSSNLNLGYRHLLPILPPLLALIGGLELVGPSVRILSWLLVVWLAAENVAARPHYLSYFNELAGGRNQGYRRLADSNVDWGQDLPAFARWVASRRAAGDQAPIRLQYFGVDSAGRFGVNAKPPFATADEPLDGWYCYSATALVDPPQRGLEWGAADEAAYQNLSNASKQAPLDRRRAESLRELKRQRLAVGLWPRTPDANIGGSILAYRLQPADVIQFLFGPPPRLNVRAAR